MPEHPDTRRVTSGGLYSQSRSLPGLQGFAIEWGLISSHRSPSSGRDDSLGRHSFAWNQSYDHRIGVSGCRRENGTIYVHGPRPRCDPPSLRCFAMTTILDDQLYSHSDRLAGKVVLITGECFSPRGRHYGDLSWSPQAAERALEERQRSSAPSTSMLSLVWSSESEVIVRSTRPGPSLCWATSMNPWRKVWPRRSNAPEGGFDVR